MRVIAGTLRGRRLLAPPGRSTRPMLDRVKEALFSILGPWLRDARVLDLYAGSGSLGLEALSRGAREARLVERAQEALNALHANVAELELVDHAEVIAADALDPTSWGGGGWDVVLMDPPYPLLRDSDTRAGVLAGLEELVRGQLAPEGVLVLHAPWRELYARDFPADLVVRERRYGTSTLWFVQAEGAEPREEPGEEEPGWTSDADGS